MNTIPQEIPAAANGGSNDEAAKRAAEDEMRRSVLARILEPAARERREPTWYSIIVSCLIPTHM